MVSSIKIYKLINTQKMFIIKSRGNIFIRILNNRIPWKNPAAGTASRNVSTAPNTYLKGVIPNMNKVGHNLSQGEGWATEKWILKCTRTLLMEEWNNAHNLLYLKFLKGRLARNNIYSFPHNILCFFSLANWYFLTSMLQNFSQWTG